MIEMMIETKSPRFLFRAALGAALFRLGVLMVLTGTGSGAFGKMMQEHLWLETAKGDREIAVEIAEAPEDMAMGLMFRTNLPEGSGMLFPSPAPREANMWMRNTYIPLDMVFIRADGVIHRIEAMTEPLSEAIIASQGDVLAVLELPGGAAGRMGLKPGDHVRHRVFQAPR